MLAQGLRGSVRIDTSARGSLFFLLLLILLFLPIPASSFLLFLGVALEICTSVGALGKAMSSMQHASNGEQGGLVNNTAVNTPNCHAFPAKADSLMLSSRATPDCREAGTNRARRNCECQQKQHGGNAGHVCRHHGSWFAAGDLG